MEKSGESNKGNEVRVVSKSMFDRPSGMFLPQVKSPAGGNKSAANREVKPPKQRPYEGPGGRNPNIGGD